MSAEIFSLRMTASVALRCRPARIGLPAGQIQIVFRPAVVRYGR
jgi:hypothetical protein